MSYSNVRIALVTVFALTVSLISAVPASADEVAGHVANARSKSLPSVASAERVAAASATAMATAGSVFHANLSPLLGTCNSAGEIVGSGPHVTAVFEAFQLSAPHWDILTNPIWNGMGTGTAYGSDGRVFVSVVFCTLADPPPGAVEEAADGAEATPGSVQLVGLPIGPKTSPTVRRTELRRWLDPQAASMLTYRLIVVCGAGGGTGEFDQRARTSCVHAT